MPIKREISKNAFMHKITGAKLKVKNTLTACKIKGGNLEIAKNICFPLMRNERLIHPLKSHHLLSFTGHFTTILLYISRNPTACI